MPTTTAAKRAPLLDRWTPGKPVVLLDTETTGNVSDDTRPDTNCPIQIGMVVLHPYTLAELGAFESLIRPQNRNRNPLAMAVHQIPEHRLQRAPRCDEVVARIERFLLGGRALRTDAATCDLAASYYLLCGHNYAYDRRFFQLMYQRAELPEYRFGETGLCTQRLAKRLIREGKLATPGGRAGLDTLLRVAGFHARGIAAHTALDDVRKTAQILRYLARLDGVLGH